MKKVLSLVFVLILTAMLPKAIAQSFEVVAPTGQSLSYYIENGEAVLNGHGQISGALTIPDSVTYENVNHPVVRISSYVFTNCSDMTSVTVPATVTTIDYYAFDGCNGLTQVNYGGTLAQWVAIDFGWNANPLIYAHHLYINNQEATSLVIPEGVTIIKRYAFHGCSGAETVTLPSTLDSVGEGAFYDCNGLARVYCGSLADWCRIGFENEQSNPIYWARKLYVGNTRVQNSLVIPDGVTEIKPYAFIRLNQIYSVQLPEGLLKIGHRVFWEWEWNTSYNVPSTVTSIGEYAFYGNGPIYYDAVNCTVERRSTWDAGAVALPQINRLVVGAGVQRIPRYLLPYDDYLSVIQMKGSTPPQVANFAFDNMRSRVVIQVPCGLMATYRTADGWNELQNTFQETPPYTLSFGIMEHCNADFDREPSCTQPARIRSWATESGWRLIRWSDGVTENYRDVVLTSDTVITPIYGPELYDTLNGGLVVHYVPNSTGLTLENITGTISGALVIPDSVMYMGEMRPVTEIRCGDFNEQRGMTSVTLPKGLTFCSGFYECTGLTRVNFNGTLAQWCNIQFECWHCNPTRYAHHLYINDEEVLNPVIPEGVSSIGYYSFVGLTSMTTITLPVSLDTISPGAFDDCNGLVRVNYNGTLADWCGIGFAQNPLSYAHHLYIGGSEVVDLIIPEGVTEIKPYAFQGIQNINVVSLPEGLQSIGNNAFGDIWPNEGVTIPSTVTTIGDYAVRGNPIYFNAVNCTSIENNSFPDWGTIVVGENVQVLPTNIFSERIYTLRMLGNPPTVAQYALERLRADCQVRVPCGLQAAYLAADEWSAVPNLSEVPIYNITFGEAEHGRAYVQTEATCTTPAQIRAENDGYYHFVQWADGNTNNPRSVTLTQDTLFTPQFALDNYSIAVEVYDTTQGWVAINSQRLGQRTEITVQALDTITIEAHAKAGFRFVRWDDWDYDNWSDSVRRVIAHYNRTYYPQFESHSFCDTLANGVVFCYSYREDGMTLNNLTGTLSGDVVIPDSVEYEGTLYPVTGIDCGFSNQTEMTSLTLPKGLLRVGSCFDQCNGLTRVNYGGTVADWCSIDFINWCSNPLYKAHHLFIGGQEIIDLVIPEGVTEIKQHAFYGLSAMATVTLPTTLDTIGYRAFCDCNGLIRTNYNGTLAQWCRIGMYPEWATTPMTYSGNLYIGGSKLTNIEIPEGVIVIKPFAFYGVNNISSIQLPEGLVSIGRNAFENAWPNSITVPSTVTSIGEYALRGGMVYYNAVNCSNMSNNAIPDASTLVVGENVEVVPTYLITNNIYQLNLQGNPPTVASYALERLREDVQVKVKCGLLSLYQEHAVWSTLGSRLTESNTYAIHFSHVENAEAWINENATCSTPAQIQAQGNNYHHFVMWSDGVTDNPRTVNLTQDTLFTPVIVIDTYTVTPVVCNDWNERGYVTGGGTVEALQTVTIAAHANPGYYFTGWDDGDGQAERTLEATWSRQICAYFEEMQYVEGQLYYRYIEGRGMMVSGHNGDIEGHLVIPDTVTFDGDSYPVIGVAEWALGWQNNMTAVTLPATIDTMAYSAFGECYNLASVYYNGTLAQWCSIWFGNDSSNPLRYGHHLYIDGQEVINLTIPEGVTEIGQYAFYGCDEIVNVTLPSTLDTIGYYAFGECNSLGRTRFLGSIAQWCTIGFGNERSNPIFYSRNLYLGSSRVANLVIPAGVTTVKPYVFYRCNSLTSVTFGEDVRIIGGYAFESCDNLTTVNFAPNLTYIGDCAFRYCSRVSMFDLPDSLRSIESGAFWDCYNATLIIPAGVTYISDYVFWTGPLYYNAVNCPQLSNSAFPSVNTIVVGEGVQVLPYGLINNNISTLKMQCEPPVVMNYALDKLSDNATVQVKCGLMSLYEANDEWNELNLVEANTNSITLVGSEHGYAEVQQAATCSTSARVYAWSYGGWHFGRWSDGVRDNPREVVLTQDTVLTPVFFEDFYDTMPDGTVFYYYYNGEGLTLGGVNGTLSGTVVIPDSVVYDGELLPVTQIWTGDFHEQRAMTSVTLPKGLTYCNGFYECTGLTRVNFGGTMEQWCAINFDNWHSNPTHYAHRLFVDGEEVINLVIPEGVTSVGRYAFRGLNNMVSVTLPATIDTIGEDAFADCNGLRRTTYGGTVADWCGIGLYGYWSNPLVVTHNLYIGGSKLTSLVIPEGVTRVKPYVFTHLYNLNSVELPEGLLSIGREAFWSCDWNLEFVIPSTVTEIEENAISSGGTLYYNAMNCSSMSANAIPNVNTVVVGEGVQTLPTNLITGSTWTLKMQGLPPTVQTFALDRMPEGSQVQVKCGLLSTYQSTPVWDSANLVETNTYTLKFGSAEHGHAETWNQATCTTPAQVYAYNDSYYHFVQWTDGNIDNPRTIDLTQDTMLTPMFVIDTYTVAVEIWDTLQGWVSGGGRVQAFDTVSFEAHAYRGFNFVRWDDWDEGWEDTVRNLEATGDRTYHPQFVPVSFCDTMESGVSVCYYYNGKGMTLQSVSGNISGIFVIPDSVDYEGWLVPVTQIDGGAFGGQNNMTWVTLPKGLTRVGCDAFWGCDNLMRVNWGGSIEQWCGIDFDCWTANPIGYARHLFMNGSEVVNLVIPEGITVIKQYAFNRLSSIASVTLPSTLDSIAYGAFEDCNGLRRTYFGGTVEDWCRIGFADDWSAHPLTYSRTLYIGGEIVNSLVIPEGITAIKPYAFCHLGSLHSIELPEGLLSIGREAFWDCNWSLSVTIPSTVTRIEENAILSNSTLYYNAVNCGYMANNALPYFNTVYVDDAVQSIPTYLITGNIQHLKMQGYPPSVTGDVLDRLDSNALVHVPCGLLSTYQTTPVWQDANLVESNTYALKFGTLNHGYAGIQVEPTCTTAAEISAWSDAYYHFAQWSDGVTANPRSVMLTQDTVFTPVFVIDTYYVQGYVSPYDEYGMVEGSDTVAALDTVTLTAHANYGYHFLYWSYWTDEGPWEDSVLTLQATWHTDIAAVFDRNAYEVSLTVDDSTPYGTVEGGGEHYYLDQVAVSAHPSFGYHFVQWNDGNTDNPRYISLTQDTAFTASFAISQFDVNGMAMVLEDSQADSIGNMDGSFFSFNFEDGGSNWTLSNNNYVNRWYIANLEGSNNALFISNDNGATNSYDGTQPSDVYAYTSLYLTAGQYSYSYDWRCNAEHNYDYLRVALVPQNTDFAYQWGTSGVPSGAIALDGGSQLCQSSSWSTHTGSVNITDSGTYYLVFYWRNDNSVQHTPAAAVDNIMISNGGAMPSPIFSGSCEVTGNDTVDYLDSVTLTAVAGYGYHFIKWSDGATENPHTVVADRSKTVYAIFGYDQFTLTLTVDSLLYGSAVDDNAGNYNYLSVHNLTATPNYGYHFVEWNDGVTDNPRSVALSQDTAFAASFAKNVYTVSALTANATMGSAASSESAVEYLETVTLTATPNYGYHFVQWNDGVTTNPRTVQVTGNVTLTAQFASNHYSVSLAVDDAVHGNVSGAGTADYLSSRTITATANYGYHFVQWNDGNTDNPRTFTLTRDTAFTALFANNVYTLTLSSSDELLGSVSGSGNYEYLDSVEIAATVTAEHHHFVQWSDGSTAPVRTVVITQDSTLTAIFAIDTHTVVTVARAGSADGMEDNASCGSVTGAGSYPYGTVLTLSATASDGYHFAEWDNGDRTLDRTVTVTSDTLIAAVFTDDVTPNLCMVSVQNGRNVLGWPKDLEVQRYNIYREANTAGVYAMIASIPYDSVSIWIDTTSRPTTRSYRYKMTATDIYGYESDFGTVHKTMHLTISQGIGTSWNLVWTEYEGADYTTYVIYRGTNAYNIEQIDIMPSGGNTTYTDEDAPTGDVYYQVGIILANPCNPSKSSNIVLSNIATNGSGVGVSDVSSDNVEIFSVDGRIIVQGAEGNDVYVYDVNGRVIDRKQEALSTVEFRLSASGVYFVKVGKAPARRVVVIR